MPIQSNYPFTEQWVPLAVYGLRAPFRRKLRASTNKHSERYENEQSKMSNGARAAFA